MAVCSILSTILTLLKVSNGSLRYSSSSWLMLCNSLALCHCLATLISHSCLRPETPDPEFSQDTGFSDFFPWVMGHAKWHFAHDSWAIQRVVQHMSHGEWGQCTAHGGWRINYLWVMGCTIHIVGPCLWIIGCTTKIWSTYFSWTMGCTGIYLSHRPWNVQ